MTRTSPPDTEHAPADAVIRCAASDSFPEWLSRCGGSLAVTTYQAGKVALIGWDPAARQVTLLLRQFQKPMGLALRSPDRIAGTGIATATSRIRQLALATRHEVLLLADAPLLAADYLETAPVRYDALYLPRAAHFTGDLNVHDLAFDASGRLWLCNTRFSCLSWLSDEFSFVPKWKPPFVSDVVPEDRCHLNGLAMSPDGNPKYVTCLGDTNAPGAWREGKATGGVLVDVDTNAIVLRGLSMPHSPRLNDGALWLLNSGAGELWRVDVSRGSHDVVCALPGYLRGLCFVGPHYAAVGLCQVREKHIFGGLPVQQRHPRLLCGVAVIDLRSGKQAAMFEFTSGAQELYDVQFLPNVHRPMILNLEKDAARQAFTAPDFAYWLRPGSELPPPPSPPTA
jgi:uncharacterized protein (TIGR03032 family)